MTSVSVAPCNSSDERSCSCPYQHTALARSLACVWPASRGCCRCSLKANTRCDSIAGCSALLAAHCSSMSDAEGGAGDGSGSEQPLVLLGCAVGRLAVDSSTGGPSADSHALLADSLSEQSVTPAKQARQHLKAILNKGAHKLQPGHTQRPHTHTLTHTLLHTHTQYALSVHRVTQQQPVGGARVEEQSNALSAFQACSLPPSLPPLIGSLQSAPSGPRTKRSLSRPLLLCCVRVSVCRLVVWLGRAAVRQAAPSPQRVGRLRRAHRQRPPGRRSAARHTRLLRHHTVRLQ